MDTGNAPPAVGMSEDMANTVRFPPGKTVQVSARVPSELEQRLDHYGELLKAHAVALGRPTIDEVERSFIVREALPLGLDQLLNRFGGWLASEEDRAKQLEEVRAGRIKPKPEQ